MSLNFVICASASFYEKIIKFSYKFEEQGITVILPKTSARMKQENRKNDEAQTDWSVAPVGYHGKAILIREHFNEIALSDAILMMNYEKTANQITLVPMYLWKWLLRSI